MKLGVCGIGRFGSKFVPLFNAHPRVRELTLADQQADRVEPAAKEHGARCLVGSLDELCASDVDAIALFTQRHLHGPHAIQCLEAGKHVFSAVPAASTRDELDQLVRAVERTGQIYMTAETSYYYPAAIYCRQRYKAGDFGRFVYGEAQYLHDMDHFYESFRSSGGPDWKRKAGIPPMYYPTHSLSLALSVTGAHITALSCFGVEDAHADGIFRQGANDWDNPFSNQCAMMRTSDGGVLRVNELRRVGHTGGNGVYMSLFGTEACFEQHATASCWTTKRPEDVTDLTAELFCPEKFPGEPEMDVAQTWINGVDEQRATGLSKVHNMARLPDTFRGLRNGHYGSHQFLVDDFVRACTDGRQPPCHVWAAANWCAPGLVAHASSMRGGELMDVPHWQPPADVAANVLKI